MRPRSLSSLALLLLGSLCAPGLHAQVSPGWTKVTLPALTYYQLYVPAQLDPQAPSPLVIFLHGAGSTPETYLGALADAAESVGAVLALPKSSSGLGWGAGTDQALIEATLSNVQSKIAVDPARVSLSGHSAGGAYAYLLAYATELRVSSVFTLGAPFQPLSALVGDFVPPIRMFYGTADPNHDNALPQLVSQWNTLGVRYEVEELNGAEHNDLPAESVVAGLQFAVTESRPLTLGATCESDDNQLCVLGGRFRITVGYSTASDDSGVGHVAGLRSDGSGLFWFFDSKNWELLVKMIDGCSFNQSYWVLLAASTDLAFTVTATDLETGEVKTYSNQLGHAAPAVIDIDAFPTCPS